DKSRARADKSVGERRTELIAAIGEIEVPAIERQADGEIARVIAEIRKRRDRFHSSVRHTHTLDGLRIAHVRQPRVSSNLFRNAPAAIGEVPKSVAVTERGNRSEQLYLAG